MKKIISSLLTLGLAGGLWVAKAVAADNELEVSSDRTKNPITGTVTETKKTRKQVKRANGKTAKSEVTRTKTFKTDGTVEEKVESESSAE